MATSLVDSLIDEFAEAWSRHDVEQVLSLCTDDCVYEDVTMGAVNRGKAEIRAFAGAVFAAFPDFTMTMTSKFGDANWAGAEWTMSGTHRGDMPGLPATGKGFSLRGASICELQAGKLKRVSDYWDMAAFLKQTGA